MNSARPTPDTCGCCAGLEAHTLVAITNRPGLSGLAYRVGTHGSFKASMQLGLSRLEALRALKTRDTDDPSIAVIDAWASVLDVLTFYQERIANEAYLHTATERRSVLDMARAIGYELSPGVAASTELAFELETLPGVPNTAGLPSAQEAFPSPGVPDRVTIEAGTKVQSLPGPDEQPQTFETIETIEARPTWNTLKPRETVSQNLSINMTTVWLQGVDANLKTGDVLMITVPQATGGSIRAIRSITSVHIDQAAQRTQIHLETSGPSPTPGPSGDPSIQIFRVKAAPFGHNAPKRPIFDNRGRFTGEYGEWPLAVTDTQTSQLTLDAMHDQIQIGSWIVIDRPDPGGGRVTLISQANQVQTRSRADYSTASRVTQLTLDAEWLPVESDMDLSVLRDVVVYAQPEELALAETPLTTPVWQDEIVLDHKVEDLPRNRALIVRGKRMRLRIAVASHPLSLTSLSDPPVSKLIQSGDEFIIVERPADVAASPNQKQWLLRDMSGFEGVAALAQDQWTFAPSAQADALVTERATLKSTTLDDQTHTQLQLTQFLAHVYDRTTVTIYANVAQATHGETKHEVLGSGDAAQTFQKFGLKQVPPLTFVSAPTPSGTANTLKVRVNDITWQEVSSLYDRTAQHQNYIARLADSGQVTVQFGDGVSGARLPSGTENVVATYRVGTGLAGMLKAEQLSLLMTRPLGVKGVTNPLAPTGAADPEQLSDARQNAPFTVLTLDRVVSLQDYENFARAFAGIGKAQATWLWDREQRLVHLTVAAADGGAVDATSLLYQNLQRAIESAGDGQLFRLDSYQPLSFTVQAKILVDHRFITEQVKAAVSVALQQAFSFQERAFGQPVTHSEVLAVIQAVDGIIAVDLDTLAILGKQEAQEATREPPKSKPLLPAQRAHWDDATSPPQLRPAELLTLAPQEITLTEMQS